MSNVAEGFGGAVGNSVANNAATITFKVTGTGKPLVLSFTDAYCADRLDGRQRQGDGNRHHRQHVLDHATGRAHRFLRTYAPGALNQPISSQFGVPPTNSVSQL